MLLGYHTSCYLPLKEHNANKEMLNDDKKKSKRILTERRGKKRTSTWTSTSTPLFPKYTSYCAPTKVYRPPAGFTAAAVRPREHTSLLYTSLSWARPEESEHLLASTRIHQAQDTLSTSGVTMDSGREKN